MNATLTTIFQKLRKPGKASAPASLTSTEIAAAIEDRRTALADAQARLSATERKYAAALDALDATSMTTAEAETAGIRNEIKVAKRAISALEPELSKQLVVEERERFRAAAKAFEGKSSELTAFVEAEYPGAARKIAAILARIQAYEAEELRLKAWAARVNETVSFENPFAALKGPQRWRGQWPNPDGTGVVQDDPKSAPHGMFKWIDGEPVPVRDGASAIRKPVDWAPSLTATIKLLPALSYGDKPFWPPQSSAPIIPAVPRGIDTSNPPKREPVLEPHGLHDRPATPWLEARVTTDRQRQGSK